MRCEYCQSEFPVEDEQLVGQEVRCPACGIPNCCSDRRVLIICPLCRKELEGELWMLGNTAECTYCGKTILLSRPKNPGDDFSNAYLPSGYVLGDYTIKRCISCENTHEVYLVHHKGKNQNCVLKLFRSSQTDSLNRSSLESLVTEAQLAGRIQSPNIVAILDAQLDKTRNLAYIVTELADGTNIEVLLSQQSTSEDYVLNVAREVAKALVEASFCNITHREIKPENIIVTQSDQIKLAGFGIAKSSQNLFRNGNRHAAGTINYVSPEQLLSSADADCRSDIYSLGAVMYHMLSGRPPFEGNTTKAVFSQVLKGSLLPLEKIAPHVSKETCGLVRSMMALQPDSRPRNAEQLLEKLEKIISSRSLFNLKKISLPGKKVLISSAAGVLLLLLLLLFLLIPGKDRSPEKKMKNPLPPAEQKAARPQKVKTAPAAAPATAAQATAAPKQPPAAAPATAAQATAAPKQPPAAAQATPAPEQPPAAAQATAAPEQPPAAASANVLPQAKKAVPSSGVPAPAPQRSNAVRGSSEIDFIQLLFLVAWILSGAKVLTYLKSKKVRKQKQVELHLPYWNLAAIVAGPLVFIAVILLKYFNGNVKKIFEPKLSLPEIIDSQGKIAFSDNKNTEDSEIIFYVKKMLANALTLHASDIFIDPKTGDISVLRFRVDGGLRIIDELNSELGAKIINVIKVAAGMDITERRRPQDGAFSLTSSKGNVSLRVATVGAFSGEKVALRILGDDSGPKTLAAAGISGKELLTMEQAARLPSGMVLICGPTGSGKTTTLYAMLNSIDYSIKNVISIEDPIEHVIPAISQMEVNESAGISFSKLLRNALRQNPDVICLGEIRDEDTAQVAIHAAQTGHLIIATLHSNDNIGTIDRLANLNIPLRSIAGTLRVVISQRLIRKLCTCKKHRIPSQHEVEELKKHGISCEKIYIPGGCSKCGNTGYSGRMALFDILTVDDELRGLLEDEHTNLSNIQKRLELSSKGNVMVKAGYGFVAKGITSFEEVQRVTLELKS